MTLDGRYNTLTVRAGADLTGTDKLYKAVTVSGTIAATPATAIGLSRSKANTGEGLTVGWCGEMKAYAGAAISAGALVTVTASGWLITGTNSSYVGKALEAAASGHLFRGLFDFTQAG